MSMSVFVEKMPTEITEEIERFCEEIAPGQTPVFVSVQPQPNAVIDGCHTNVEQHVKANGGTPIYGWIIWQSPALLNAVFHCNWLSESGTLSDITPKSDGETKILFLPDPARRWEGRCVASRRKGRRSGRPIGQFVTIMEQIDRIKAKYRPGEPFSLVDQQRTLNLMMEAGRDPVGDH